MKIKEIMSRSVHLATPDQSIREAAAMMEKIEARSLPVAENGRLVGTISDRDIALRAVAKGLPSDTKIRDVMSTHVRYCFDDEELESVVDNIREIRLRRLPVLDREKRLVGIISLGDLSAESEKAVGRGMRGIADQHAPMRRSA